MSAKRGKKLDLFCWKCHKSETNIGCIRCERSFHNKCISMTKSIQDFAPNWVCNECTEGSAQTNCPLDEIQLQQMLLSSLKMISKSADYYFKSDNCFVDKRIKVNSNLIVNPLNLNKIEDKVNEFEYKSFRQMTSDFKWILHNCIIGELESELLENAKFLLSKVKSEQKDFEECVHCFINYYKSSKSQYYSWFSKPCPQMHQIVWAKVRGHPYWPSKVIKINQQNGSVLVRFFGTHQTSWVKERDCCLISEESPKQLKGKSLQMGKLLDTALEELKYNIKYLNEEYPNWFKYSPKNTPFSIKETIANNPNYLSPKSSESHSTNGVINCRPKARKTFANPSNSSSHKSEEKPKQNIEVIEFSSDRTTNKRELILSDQCIEKRIKTDAQNNCHKFQYISQQISNNIKVPTVEPIKTVNCVTTPQQLVTDVNHKIESNIKEGPKIDENPLESDLNKTLFANKCFQKRVKALEKTIEIKDNNYRKQIMEVQHKSDLAIEQMRRSFEIEKQRAVFEERNKQISINIQKLNEMKTDFETQTNDLIAKHKSEIISLEQKFDKELKESKTKNWCFSCLKEAQLYCCSHTYYCSNECQISDWEHHKHICTQK